MCCHSVLLIGCWQKASISCHVVFLRGLLMAREVRWLATFITCYFNSPLPCNLTCSRFWKLGHGHLVRGWEFAYLFLYISLSIFQSIYPTSYDLSISLKGFQSTCIIQTLGTEKRCLDPVPHSLIYVHSGFTRIY